MGEEFVVMVCKPQTTSDNLNQMDYILIFFCVVQIQNDNCIIAEFIIKTVMFRN
jgi:hypothetical protein